jgi:DNA polymerase-1
MAQAPSRLYLIDGYSNIFRAFYAIRELSNSKGEPTNAVWGFLNMLRKLLREEQPELVGIALDVSSDTIRKEQYADYKANRKPMPDDLRAQIPWIRKLIEAHRIPILELEKYEADDVLGTLSRAASAAGLEVVIVSADKDLMQLVGERVSLFHTGREKLYGPQEVFEDYGVPPEKIVDYLALVGDTSDNVPGVPLIGGKTLTGGAPRSRRRGQRQARRESAQPPRRRRPVARPGDHPHRSAAGVRARRAAPRPAGSGAAA